MKAGEGIFSPLLQWEKSWYRHATPMQAAHKHQHNEEMTGAASVASGRGGEGSMAGRSEDAQSRGSGAAPSGTSDT